MRRALAFVMCLTVTAFAAPAAAADPIPPTTLPAASAKAPLFVELVVNGRSEGEIVALRIDGEALYLERAVLRQAQVRVEGDGEMDVAHAPGLKARYDVALQRLELEVSPDLLPVSHIASRGAGRVATTAAWGGLLNYDLYMVTGEGQLASLWSEQRVFGPRGVISNTGVFVAPSSGGVGGYRRHDTFARVIDEDRARALTMGDFITQSLPWTRSVRMGGVQVSRAFRVRPDLITMPLPSFAGETAVPSAVDLFINGHRQQTTNVTPGRFVLDSAPVVTGAGEATIVTTDAVGRQVQTTVPFYVSAELLRPGLSDFSFEAGFLRRGYGADSFDYGPAAASATIRHGLSSELTVEAHAEVAPGLAGIGGAFAWAPRRLGTITASLSLSQADGQRGSRWSLGYEYTAPGFGLAYQHEEHGPQFRDLGDIGAPPRAGSRSDRLIGNLNFKASGTLALAYLDGETLNGPKTRLVSASYHRVVGRRATLLVSLDCDLKEGSTGAQIRLAVPFGRHSVGLAASRVDGRTLSAVDYARAMPSDGGVNVSAGVARDQNGKAYGQGSLALRTRAVELQAGGAFADRQRSGWVGATGGLAFMDGHLFAVNQISDAFAVVSTGLKDVTVFYENQAVGRTGRTGRLFVPHVVSYQNATFAIDTLSLSEGYVTGSVSTQMALREGAGAVVRLPVRKARPILVALVDAAGRPLEPGGVVQRPDGGASTVGWDGLVYLEDVGAVAQLTVHRRDGSRCEASLVVPADVEALSKIGPATCA